MTDENTNEKMRNKIYSREEKISTWLSQEGDETYPLNCLMLMEDLRLEVGTIKSMQMMCKISMLEG